VADGARIEFEEDRNLGLLPTADADQVFDEARFLMRAGEMRRNHVIVPFYKFVLKKARPRANLLQIPQHSRAF
jgi:hypothetical protein